MLCLYWWNYATISSSDKIDEESRPYLCPANHIRVGSRMSGQLNANSHQNNHICIERMLTFMDSGILFSMLNESRFSCDWNCILRLIWLFLLLKSYGKELFETLAFIWIFILYFLSFLALYLMPSISEGNIWLSEKRSSALFTMNVADT